MRSMFSECSFADPVVSTGTLAQSAPAHVEVSQSAFLQLPYRYRSAVLMVRIGSRLLHPARRCASEVLGFDDEPRQSRSRVLVLDELSQGYGPQNRDIARADVLGCRSSISIP